MILARSVPQFETGAIPEEGLMAEMAECHEQLARAGLLLAADGGSIARTGCSGARPTGCGS